MRETNYLKDNEKVLRILKDADKFSPFSSADIMSFLDHGKLLEYDKDEEIFGESRQEIFLYFIMSGGVRISRNGKELKTLRRTGEFFGDISHVKPSARPVTATALQKALVLRLDISKADKNLDSKDLALGYTIYRIFCEVLTDKLRICTAKNEALKKQLAALTA